MLWPCVHMSVCLSVTSRQTDRHMVEGDGGGGHWLVRMEWRPAGWSVCLPLLISPCTIKSRSFLLAPGHLDGPGKRVVKQLWWCGLSVTSRCCTKMAEDRIMQPMPHDCSSAKDLWEIRRGLPPYGVPNAGGVGYLTLFYLWGD